LQNCKSEAHANAQKPLFTGIGGFGTPCAIMLAATGTVPIATTKERNTTMRKFNKGFTLVEIMIVVAIIAILAAIAIPNFIAYRNESQGNACVGNMATIKTAAETYLTKHPGTAPTADNLVNSDGTGLLKTMPKCPKSGGDYTISLTADGAIEVTCATHNADGSEASSGSSTPEP